jgi:hypothetical protein
MCIAHFLGSKTPAFLRTSAKTGTVELTGLEMTRMKALGQALAMASARVAQIPALTFLDERSFTGTYEEVITGHAGLAGDTSGDDDNVGSLESLLRAVVGREEASDLGWGGDVREVRSDLEISAYRG